MARDQTEAYAMSGCRFESEAKEPEVSICNYCGEEIPYSDEPAWCSEACKEADEEYAAGDARADLEAV